MKLKILAFCVSVAAVALADSVTVSNRVVMVDQAGRVNAPEVLATTAQLATNEVQVIAAAESARVAEKTAIEATNAVQSVVSAIVNNEVVVYRSGFNDSFGSVVLISENAKLMIYNFVPGQDNGGTRTHQIYYALNEDIGAVKPIIRASSTLADFPGDDFTPVADSSVTDPVVQAGEFTDRDGNKYTFLYRIDVTVPSHGQYFFKVYVDGDTPSGDGYTFDVKNGITGGLSETVTWGDKRLTFTGGLLTGVANE